MTLKFINEVKSEITNNLPDNNSGLITPGILRQVLQDMTDSLYARGAALYGAPVSPVAQLLTTTPTVYPALTPLVVNNNPTIFTVNQPAGTITILVSGFFFQFTVGFTVDGPTNTDVILGLYKNGALLGDQFISTQTTGAGEKKTVQATFPEAGIVVDDVFDIRLSSNPGASINFSALQLFPALQPTFSAV